MKIFLIAVVFSLFTVLFADELKDPRIPKKNEETKGLTFTDNVQRTRGRVSLRKFRSTAQKGETCNVYSTIMILRYFRCYNITPRDLKRGGDGYKYKYSNFIRKKLAQYGFEYLIFPVQDISFFSEMIKKSIDNGIPIHWIVDMRLSPIEEERAPTHHARIIIGYFHRNGKVKDILYADSWGRSSLHKKMGLDSAYKMTATINFILPKDLDEKTKIKLLPAKDR